MPFFNWKGKVKKTGQVKTFQSHNIDFETVEQFEEVVKLGHPGIEYVEESGEIVAERSAEMLPMPAGAGEHGIKAAVVAGKPFVAPAPAEQPAKPAT